MALRVRDYVKQLSQAKWGTGVVVSIGETEKVKVFFLQGGKRILQQLF
jgi:hypothetical protein